MVCKSFQFDSIVKLMDKQGTRGLSLFLARDRVVLRKKIIPKHF